MRSPSTSATSWASPRCASTARPWRWWTCSTTSTRASTASWTITTSTRYQGTKTAKQPIGKFLCSTTVQPKGGSTETGSDSRIEQICMKFGQKHKDRTIKGQYLSDKCFSSSFFPFRWRQSATPTWSPPACRGGTGTDTRWTSAAWRWTSCPSWAPSSCAICPASRCGYASAFTQVDAAALLDGRRPDAFTPNSPETNLRETVDPPDPSISFSHVGVGTHQRALEVETVWSYTGAIKFVQKLYFKLKNYSETKLKFLE